MGAGKGLKPPTTRKTEASGDRGIDEEITSGPAPPPPLSPQRGTASDRVSKTRSYRHPNGGNGARPKRANKYGLLDPAEPAGDLAAAKIQ